VPVLNAEPFTIVPTATAPPAEHCAHARSPTFRRKERWLAMGRFIPPEGGTTYGVLI
jgi:hypothetical protein